VQETRVSGRRLEAGEVQTALAIVMLYLLVALASWFAFVVGGHAPLDSLFEVVSALGTVGLSAGVATPELGVVLKLVLCADMIMGRLEIVAFLILFWPRSWIGRRTGT
jgi:trk system potassium uptake protein TrkH